MSVSSNVAVVFPDGKVLFGRVISHSPLVSLVEYEPYENYSILEWVDTRFLRPLTPAEVEAHA